MSRRRPDEAAQNLLDKYSVAHAPVPVEKIAASEGAEIVRQRSEGQESGFALRMDGRWIIGINTQTSRLRQRFSVAHELGHLLLHEGKPLIVSSARIDLRDSVSSMGTNTEEIEANRFAAELLMPRALVIHAFEVKLRKSVSSRDELVSELAHEFDVSTDAMGYRLINLGILTA
ncbi:ImmA/IrrE family metallo-endopeptidase [Amycolatopsis sp. NPDC051102]|uniref:ImmA/IrrE family metallo-endopeptidase n=1 Tax=Amycolatopsis sp. NPDC051102 TaxID=3155163 RepID=UPI003445D336